MCKIFGFSAVNSLGSEVRASSGVGVGLIGSVVVVISVLGSSLWASCRVSPVGSSFLMPSYGVSSTGVCDGLV